MMTLRWTLQTEGRRRAGALLGETTRYLLVYEEGSMAGVTEDEVRQESEQIDVLSGAAQP